MISSFIGLPLRCFVIALCLVSQAFAAVDAQVEQDIQAILKFIPASERENVAGYLRKPGPPATVPTLVAGNALNKLSEEQEAKVALPLTRRMVSFLDDTKGNERNYAFNKAAMLADKNSEAAALVRQAFTRIANNDADPLQERARKFLAQTPEQRNAAASAAIDKNMTRALVGTWLERGEGNPSTIEFKADGTFSNVVWKDAKRREAMVTFRGKWTVENQHLVYDTQSSSDLQLKFPQPKIRDKILDFGVSQRPYLIYQGADGEKVRMEKLDR